MKRKPGISHDQAMTEEQRENPEFDYKNKLLLLQSICHNRWPRPLMCVFIAVIERTYPEGWHA